MSELRQFCIDDMADALDVTKHQYETLEDAAEAALDALLDTLWEHAEEWSRLEAAYHLAIGEEDAWHSEHADELRHLAASLRSGNQSVTVFR